MYKYVFKNGEVITSKLSKQNLLNRMNRLGTLIVMTEQYEEGRGKSICEKALKAYNKKSDFTGIIRLSLSEKDFICCMLENDFINDEDRKVLNSYLKFS